jgi:Protein of unknown function (DUF5672)
MKLHTRVVVVIPIYKKIADEQEQMSLMQCLKVLCAYPIIFVCPKSMDIAYYKTFCEKNAFNNISFITFDDYYFQSIAGYCRLLLSANFFLKFRQFDYMLLYQLDAWVFRDELMEWCSKGFDYIGAPWFVGQDKSTPDSGFMEFSGNGGFSLRNIQAALNTIHAYKIIKSPIQVWHDYRNMSLPGRILRLPTTFLRLMGWKNNSIYFRNNYTLNEDNYWAYLAREAWPAFKAATAMEAIGFAFEVHPAKMYELNNYRLPFGCHAWYKYDYEFWKPFIQGNTL